MSGGVRGAGMDKASILPERSEDRSFFEYGNAHVDSTFLKLRWRDEW